ncbi:MAG: phosphoglucomutase/phosphomannomutase family protein [Elusimicrobia bacterium]|nr:phosphoglucomutase/phosphomannomutase family protein [Elusimicrobiota bacterium]
MQENNIKFGTEGWRGIISKDFTFENVAKVSQSISDYLRSTQKPSNSQSGQKIAIGYDNRFLSEKFANCCAQVFLQNGYEVIISDSSVTTPNLCFITKSKEAQIGIMITASHNPAIFNGLKAKAQYGGPVPEWLNKEIEKNIPQRFVESKIDNEGLAPVEFKDDYIKYIKMSVDFSKIGKIKQNIVFDCMHGPAYRYIDGLFGKDNKKIIKLRDTRDVLFGGFNPEPIEKYMSLTKSEVKKHKAAAGIVTDGDGDRVGVVADGGIYLPPHTVFPLLLYYQAKYKNQKPKVAQTISLGYLSERIAKKYSLEFEETPVGFKYITEKILKEGNIFGGEESCGYALPGELPDRDGILSGLTVLEMIGSSGKKLSELVKEMQKEFGKSSFMRYDFRLPEIIFDKSCFVNIIKGFISEKINGKTLKSVKTFDGIKIVLEDDSWLLMRPSGTEPLLRVYSETPSQKTTQQLIDYGKKITMNYFKNK